MILLSVQTKLVVKIHWECGANPRQAKRAELRLKAKKEPFKGSFYNGGNDEARTRDLMRDRHAL